MDLEQRRRDALYLNHLYPGIGRCGYCQRNWRICIAHSTPYKFAYADQIPLRACLPLCEECWQELTIEERLPYYHELFRSWQTDDTEVWALIEKAVRKGL